MTVAPSQRAQRQGFRSIHTVPPCVGPKLTQRVDRYGRAVKSPEVRRGTRDSLYRTSIASYGSAAPHMHRVG